LERLDWRRLNADNSGTECRGEPLMALDIEENSRFSSRRSFLGACTASTLPVSLFRDAMRALRSSRAPQSDWQAAPF